jgi:hypothetical protein
MTIINKKSSRLELGIVKSEVAWALCDRTWDVVKLCSEPKDSFIGSEGNNNLAMLESSIVKLTKKCTQLGAEVGDIKEKFKLLMELVTEMMVCSCITVTEISKGISNITRVLMKGKARREPWTPIQAMKKVLRNKRRMGTNSCKCRNSINHVAKVFGSCSEVKLCQESGRKKVENLESKRGKESGKWVEIRKYHKVIKSVKGPVKVEDVVLACGIDPKIVFTTHAVDGTIPKVVKGNSWITEGVLNIHIRVQGI